MTGDADRTVHGFTDDGRQVVRYDRAGKWYIEYPEGAGKKRRHVTITEAVRAAISGRVVYGRPGGLAFEARVRKVLSER